MHRERCMAVFSFLDHKARQRSSVSPVGKLTDQHRILRQRQRAEERQRRLLFGIADDLAAVQHRRPVLVLESAHPSPLSAYRGFFGSAPFGKINAFLQQHGEAAIDWLK